MRPGAGRESELRADGRQEHPCSSQVDQPGRPLPVRHRRRKVPERQQWADAVRAGRHQRARLPLRHRVQRELQDLQQAWSEV